MIILCGGKNRHALPNAEEMSAFDAQTIASGIKSEALMERAGLVMLHVLEQRLCKFNNKPKVLCLCGHGNNGGDGLVVARLLNEKGWPVKCLLVGSKAFSSECKEQLKKFIEGGGEAFTTNALAGFESIALADSSRIIGLLQGCNVVIDAILGIGQRSAPHGEVLSILKVVAQNCVALDSLRVALDVPTGIDCNSGSAALTAFKADLTLTVQNVKRGMLQYPARSFCGDIVALDIGIDSSGTCQFSLLDSTSVPKLLARPIDSHKGAFGRVLVLGGSLAMPGAPNLAAIAALRGGAGIVRIACCVNNANIPSELMSVPLAHADCFSMEQFPALQAAMSEASVLLIGPGLGSVTETNEFVRAILENAASLKLPTVIDADALNALAKAKDSWVLPEFIATPHPGEAARLLACSNSEIQADRYAAIEKCRQRWGGTWLLKGAYSLILSSLGGFVNSTGNAYMATAGSGDVLAGLVAALVGQGLGAHQAAATAAYVHGLAGDLAHLKHRGPIIASDIVENLPFALGKLNGAE